MKLSQRRMAAPSLGGVLATRQGSLMLALLCAVVAACVLVFALGRFKANVAKPIPQATVLIATGEIHKGMTGADIAADRLYRPTPVEVSQATPGALSNAAALAGATASANVLPGQQLTTGDFQTIVGVDQVVKPDQRVIEIAVGGAPGATDITQPGSHIDLYATGATEATPGHSAARPAPIASHVLVLKPATPAVVSLGNQPVSGSTLVLALPESEVASVIQHSGALYAVLDPSSTGPADIPPTTDNGAR